MEHQNKTKYPALAYPDFRIYLIGQFLSAIGSQMHIVGLSWHVFVLTNSALALGLIGLVRYIPIVIFSLVGGTAADSFNRKNIQIIGSIVQATLALIMAIMTWTGSVTPTFLYLLTIIYSSASAFIMPARNAFVPNLVEKKDLPQAMSLNIIVNQTATIIGPACAGFMIAWFGIGHIYAFNAASFFIFVFGMLVIKNSGKSENAHHVISFAAVAESFRFVRTRTVLWSSMILDFFSTLFASAVALLPLFAKEILHVGPSEVGLLYSATAIGAVTAGVIMTHLHHIRRQGVLLLVGITIFAFATILFGVSTHFVLSFIALMFIGGGDSVSTIIRHTIRQLETPDRMRGRMAAINMVFVMGGPRLGELQAGLLATMVGGPVAVVIGGTATLITIAFVVLRNPALTAYTHPIDSISDALT